MGQLTFSYHHSGVSVPDLDAAIEWYGRVLGFELVKRVHIPTIPADVAFVANGDLQFEIFQLADAAALPEDRRLPDSDLRTHGNKHAAFSVAHIETFAEELARRGADIVWVKRFPHGANCFIRDMAGNLIEFVEEPAPVGRIASL
jgi:methylmalonyl-CoA/ethylmalonyl-CoA epimerase